MTNFSLAYKRYSQNFEKYEELQKYFDQTPDGVAPDFMSEERRIYNQENRERKYPDREDRAV